jgi:predicted short-subunit dehydrogenase-like oxidoreductase (DUF2520 family)
MISKIYVVGYGNLGKHLSEYFLENNVNFGGIFTDQNISISGIDIYRKSAINQTLKAGDVLFVTTKDDEISSVIHQVENPDVVKIYCSGSVSLESLNTISNCGVWYPLYSFSGNMSIDWQKVPVFIEYSNDYVFELLSNICGQLNKPFQVLDSNQRKQLHLAAVFANNFVNACIIGANEVIKGNESLRFDYLLPIIKQTIDKISVGNPIDSQTGPAKRNDESTMSEHLNMLSNSTSEQELYAAISKYIQQKFD